MNVHLKIPDIREVGCNCEKCNSQSVLPMENIQWTAPSLRLHAYISGLQVGVCMKKKKDQNIITFRKKYCNFCLKTCLASSTVTVCFIQLLFRVKFLNILRMEVLIFSLTSSFSSLSSWVPSNQLSLVPCDFIAFFYKVCKFNSVTLCCRQQTNKTGYSSF